MGRRKKTLPSRYPKTNNHFVRSGPNLLFFLLIAVVSLVGLFVYNKQNFIIKAQTAPFAFTAAGDISANSNTIATLDLIASSGSNFHLALGDLSYDQIVPELAWCDYVKSHVGANFPFELVSGNHEDDTRTDGFIDNFAACLPDRLGSAGSYGKEYYFDYPAVSPQVRVVMIAADLNINGEFYDYTPGNSHYNWLASTIDSARNSGIPWVVVGMHKVCQNMGGKNCAVGGELTDLLTDKKVDLVLQAHAHNYQRGKQLALSSLCPSVPVDSFNASCVADDGADGNYTRGAGMVMVIAGTGGAGLVDINPSDNESGYFAKWMGANSNPRHGFMKINVSSDQLNVSFVGSTSSSNFTDSFTIGGTASPSPSALPSPSPSSSPSSSPVPTPAPGQVISLNPAADAHVRGDKPNFNYGSRSKLEVDGSPIKISYMKFDLSPLAGKTVISAKLRLKVAGSSSSTQIIKEVFDTAWSETGVTYNNRPSLGLAVSSMTSSSVGTWQEVDITSSVSGKVGQLYALGIDSSGNNGVDFNSKEAPADKPVLVVEY